MDTIGLASDHAGYALKELLKKFLESKGLTIKDYGCNSLESCDYPDFAHKLGYAIENQVINKGIVFCGSGNGINMTVNKHNGVRSALCWKTEIAWLSRHHNDANVCSLPTRFVTEKEAIEIVNVFLMENFDGERHLKRINKIPLLSY